MESLEAMSADVRRRTEELAARHGGPVGLVGHSLGAAVLATLTQEELPKPVTGVFLISPPFGTQTPPGPVMRFLLQKQLLPQFLVRPRFFSRQSPKDRQKTLFDNAVSESDQLRDTVFAPTWFHNQLLQRQASVPSLVIASDADQVVPAEQSKELAERIGAETWVSPREDTIGHDDYLAAPRVVDRLAREIVRFLEQYAED
jgi:alpha-beta hydrolase superfamily lysophospholipase